MNTAQNNNNNNKSWYKLWWVWVIVAISIFVLSPYVIMYRNMTFPESAMKDGYREFPNIATITITNFQTQEEQITIRELVDARTSWVHNQKSDWDKYGRRRYYTLDLSQTDKITVIFGYEEEFDIHTFASEIINIAYLDFVDSQNKQIINSEEITSAYYSYQGATQSYDVIMKVTDVAMQKYLMAVEHMSGDNFFININFNGSISSDSFSIEMSGNETLIIKGFINISAAESLVKLIELKEVPANLIVDLKIEQ